MNFEIVAVSDIWSRRRDEAEAHLKEKGWLPKKFFKARNNDELYEKKNTDAVIISTADFQHALHLADAVRVGQDVYVEKPFAESMEDARTALKAVEETGKIVQVGSQRRSAPNYHAANQFIKDGKFGDISMVEMTWNVNQPGRWRRPKLVAEIRREDVDWDRYIIGNRPKEDWDPRKYLEYRLFYPYSSGIPGQWMSHQIDTCTGSRATTTRAAWRPTAACTCGKTAAPTPIPSRPCSTTVPTTTRTRASRWCTTPGCTTARAAPRSTTTPTAACSTWTPTRSPRKAA
jgi:hypothetical protein